MPAIMNTLRATPGLSLVILREHFAFCHSERSEESHMAQCKLRDRRISRPFAVAQGDK